MYKQDEKNVNTCWLITGRHQLLRCSVKPQDQQVLFIEKSSDWGNLNWSFTPEHRKKYIHIFPQETSHIYSTYTYNYTYKICA